MSRWNWHNEKISIWKTSKYGKLPLTVNKKWFYCVCVVCWWCLGAVPQMFLTGPPGTVQIPVSAVPLHSVIY